MTEEIKRILNEFNSHTEYDESMCCLSIKEVKTLLDYITNLQQLYENALKINQNTEKYRTELEDKYVVLQQENKRLKEIIKDNTILVKDENGNYQECNINPLDYKSRCEKAIKDIDLLMTGNYEDCGTIYLKSSCCNKRLEIIKKDLIGSDDK